VLYSFGAAGTADGASPRSNLIQDSAGNLYGTTFSGGAHNQGTVFKISSIGSVSTLYSFGGAPGDGSQPNGALLLASDGKLYGSTNAGGVNNNGTIYQLNTTGTEKVLHSFSGSDGSNPYGQLIQARDGNLYGVTSNGGNFGNGTVFKFVM
ncbi:MAG TPA: choice-of-anchor tandem repeat GloVer-containing protein, partial [Methylobacter sp.]